MTCNVIIFEEAAFIDPDVVNTVAVPLMGVTGTVTLAISTPGDDEDNYYSGFMELPSEEDPNEKMFKIVRIGLACEKCMLKGEASSCTHKAHLLPPWKSSSRQKKIAIIQKQFKSTFERETLGLMATSQDTIFSEKIIRRFNEAPTFMWTVSTPFIFVGIDPSGGGSKSNYSIASVTRMGAYVQICGMDHSDTMEVQEVNKLIYGHLANLRKIPQFRQAMILVYIEANMSWIEADRVKHVCLQPELQPLHVISHDKEGRTGVLTTAQNKEAYVFTALDLMRTDRLSYVADHQFTTQAESQADIKEALTIQLRGFKRKREESKRPEFTPARVAMSGKSAHCKDDILMALMFVLYFPSLTLSNRELMAGFKQLGHVPL